MKLFLCEKPSQGKDIARVLGARKGGKGYLANEDGSVCVTWAIGHLVEQFSPEQYDPEWKKWNLNNLPIIPSNWKVSAKKNTKQQYNVVMQLIKKAQQVIIATDIDREGEMIARELLELARFKGSIARLWLSALDDASIRKGLKNLKNGNETESLYYAGIGRSRADWLVGMNFSRLFTLLAQQNGYQGVMSVGRVQSPTLALVVNRDRQIKNFKPKDYYSLIGHFNTSQNDVISSTLVIPEDWLNDEGICLDKAKLQAVEREVQQVKNGNITNVETKREKESAPLVFSLSSLQTKCNALYGYGAQQVLDIAQSLYETHKATTYPRSDCNYLPTEQLAEVPQVINGIFESDNSIAKLKPLLNLKQKSRVWNDKKITAHHGIIPTSKKIDISKLSDEEFNIYDLIRKHYIAQFLPPCEIDKTVINIQCGQFLFVAKGNVTVVPGWKVLFPKAGKDKKDKKDEQALPQVKINDQCILNNTELKTLTTNPPAHFTEGTLLSAMVNAARFVENEKLKKKLKETEGLGTEATRAALIENLFQKKFIKKKGKSILATENGVALVDNLPQVLRDPGMTALWEQALNAIAEGKMTLQSFMAKQEQFIKMVINEYSNKGLKLSNIKVKKCPKCNKAMIKRKGKTSEFWGCSGYPDCNHIEFIDKPKAKKRSK